MLAHRNSSLGKARGGESEGGSEEEGTGKRKMRVRRVFGMASLCLLALVVDPCGSVLLVYNTQHPPATTRFEDVPAKRGFGPRVPEEVRAELLSLATRQLPVPPKYETRNSVAKCQHQQAASLQAASAWASVKKAFIREESQYLFSDL